jgi:Bifunctional DNA primase/polymerase, N-terminal/Primase C terminal 2 (PriCT-2)
VNVIHLRPQQGRQFAIAVRHAIAAFRKTELMFEAALAYAAHGFPVFPLDPISKAPIPRRDSDPTGEYRDGIPGTGGLYKATTDPLVIRDWWRKQPRALIALPMGERSGLWALDIDIADLGEHADGTAAWAELAAQRDPFETREHRSATGGRHLLFAWSPEQPIRCGRGALPKGGIDVKGQGGYIAVPPSLRKGRSYAVSVDIDPIAAPLWLVNQILEGRQNQIHEGSDNDADPPLDDLSEAMQFVANEDLPWDDWASVGLALFAASSGSEAGFALFKRFSQQSIKYHQHETRQKWLEIKRSPPNRTGAGKLFKIARLNGWGHEPRPSVTKEEDEPLHVSPDAASEMMRQAVREFLYGCVWNRDDLVCNHFRDFACELFGPHIRAARIDVAGGKTTITIEELTDWMRSTGKRPVIYAVPRHDLSEEIVKLFARHGITAAIFRGRNADDPDNPGQQMCQNPAAVEVAMQCHADVYHSCCNNKRSKCAFFDRPCSYIGQFPEDSGPDVWIIAADMLFHSQKVLGEPVALIVDESFWRKGIRGIGDEEFEWVVPIASLLHPQYNNTVSTADPDFYRNQLGMALRAQPHDGDVECSNLTQLGILTCNEAIKLEWQCLPRIDLEPGLPPSKLKQIASSDVVDTIQHGRRVIRIWEAVRDIIRSAQTAEISGRLTLRRSNGQRVVEWRGLADIGKQFRVPTLMLDATLPDLSILNCYFPKLDPYSDSDRVEIIADVRIAMPPHTRIRQVIGAPTTSKKLDQEKHRAELRRYILQRWLETGCKTTLVVTQMKFEQWLQDKLRNNITVKHYNDISGLDKFKDVRLLILIGRTQPGAVVPEVLTAALTGRKPKQLSSAKHFNWGYRPVERVIKLADGREIPVKGDEHPDPMVESVRWQICEAELIQALGRGRAIHRTADNPLDADLLFNT